MHLEREKAIADASFYRGIKEAEANEKKLTPEFLEYTHILAVANNTKVYFGEKIPSLFVENSGKSQDSREAKENSHQLDRLSNLGQVQNPQ